jgi:hypothetical protein
MIFFITSVSRKSAAPLRMFYPPSATLVISFTQPVFFAASRRALIRRLHEWNFMYIPARSQDEAE